MIAHYTRGQNLLLARTGWYIPYLHHIVAALLPGPSVNLVSYGFFGEVFSFAFLMRTVAAVCEDQIPQNGTGIAIGGGVSLGIAVTRDMINPAIAAGEILSWVVIMPIVSGVAFSILFESVVRGVQPPHQ